MLNNALWVCPYCGSSHVVRAGWAEGVQRFLCRGCGRKHRENGLIHGHRFPPEQIGKAIEAFYQGLAFRGSAKFVMEMYHIHDTCIAPQTILLWVQNYAQAATAGMQGRKAIPGTHWEVFAVLFDSATIWWVVKDRETGYILGSHVGRGDLEASARGVIDKAKLSTNRRCKGVTYRQVRPNRRWRPRHISEEAVLRGVRRALPRVTLAPPIQGVEADYVGAEKDGFISVLEKACRKFNRVKKAAVRQTYLDGWVISYNLFDRRLVGLGRSPGQLAGVEAPFRNWGDVVRLAGRLSVSTPGYGRGE